MKNEALERPQIKDYCTDASLMDLHSTYVSNQGIWKYLQALDAYCDELEKSQCEGKPDSDTGGGLHLADVKARILEQLKTEAEAAKVKSAKIGDSDREGGFEEWGKQKGLERAIEIVSEYVP